MGLFSRLFGKGDDAAPQQPASHAGGRKILVVEPSLTVAKVIELTLDGDSVTHASTAAQAREAFTQQHPQLVLLAANLPDGDAYELARSFVNDPFRTCPVIFLRGGFEQFDEARARAAGVTEIVGKPFDPQQLIAAIERAGV